MSPEASFPHCEACGSLLYGVSKSLCWRCEERAQESAINRIARRMRPYFDNPFLAPEPEAKPKRNDLPVHLL